MNQERALTEFQKACEEALRSALTARNLALADRRVEGVSENYVCALVSGTDIVIYIYEDEAQFHKNSKLAGLYEHQDFQNAKELKEAFVQGVVEACSNVS